MTIQTLSFVGFSLLIGGPSMAVADVSDATTIQLGMFVSGLAAAFLLAWRISRWVGRIETRLDRIEGLPPKPRKRRYLQ